MRSIGTQSCAKRIIPPWVPTFVGTEGKYTISSRSPWFSPRGIQGSAALMSKIPVAPPSSQSK